jgi:hypothetical protein
MTTAAELVLETAQRAELHHAVILYGPSPETLRDLALRIAKTLNCPRGSTGDDCPVCDRIERRVHPDVHFIEVSGDRKMISIEQIRTLVGETTLRPYEGRSKVFVIDPAEGISVGGSNSLLKTLEEPTRDTTFLLLSRSPDLLLPTIRSRSQAIYVGPPKTRESGLTKDAMRLAQFAGLSGRRELAAQILEALHHFATTGESAVLLGLANLIADEENLKDAIALFAAILCDAVALDPEKMVAIRESIPRERLLSAADAAMAALRGLVVNADPRLAIEKAVAQLVTSS